MTPARVALTAVLAAIACSYRTAPLPEETSGNVTIIAPSKILTAGDTSKFTIVNRESYDIVFNSCQALIERNNGGKWTEWISSHPRCAIAGVNAKANSTVQEIFRAPVDMPAGEYRLLANLDALTGFVRIVKRSSAFTVR